MLNLQIFLILKIEKNNQFKTKKTFPKQIGKNSRSNCSVTNLNQIED